MNINEILQELNELKPQMYVNEIKEPNSPTWEVYLGSRLIGYIHDIDGLGGSIGGFTDTELFDHALHLVEQARK